MSDIDGGAAAPAESTSAPVIAETPNPVSTEAQGHPEPKPEAKPEPKAEVKAEPETKKPVSTREALLKAAEKVEKDNAKAEKPADKATPVKSEANRDETGKFAFKEPKPSEAKPVEGAAQAKPTEPKPSFTANQPPSRFSADAKSDWATAPESVRAEVSRMERELTQGFEKHRAAAERDASLNEFHEMAQRGGTDVKTALTRYVGMETLLRQDPVKGLEEICKNVGIPLRDVAAHILGRTPEQNASAQDATIAELRQELAAVKQQVGSVSQNFQQQQERATHGEVEKFAAEHPRFDELANDIAFFLKTRTKDLSEAYTLAERLNPAPALATPSEPAASSAPVIDLAAQTAKGQKSIQGSPTPGSNPAKGKASNSIKDSLRKAFAEAG